MLNVTEFIDRHRFTTRSLILLASLGIPLLTADPAMGFEVQIHYGITTESYQSSRSQSTSSSISRRLRMFVEGLSGSFA